MAPGKPGRIDPAWVVILAGVSAALHVAKLYPALPALREALGISLLYAGFLLSTVQMAGMTMGLIVGLAVDAVGLKRCMILGLFLLFVAAVPVKWTLFATNIIAFRVLEGIGFLMVITPAPSLLRRLVTPQRLGGILGIWGTYMPLATSLAMLCGPAVIAAGGWHALWWTMSGLSLLMAVWVWWAVPSEDALMSRTVAAPSTVPSWALRLRQTLLARGPWLVALCFAVYAAQWVSVIGFLPSIYAQAGVTGATAAGLTALAAAVNMIGNAGSGRLLAAGIRAHWLLYLGFGAMGLMGLAAFISVGAVSPGMAPIALPAELRYGAVLIFSMVGGIIPGTLFSLAVRLAPNDNTVSTTVGWMQQWSATGQFAGPPLVAWVASVTGGWQWTWLVTGSCALFGLLLAYQTGQHLERIRPAPNA